MTSLFSASIVDAGNLSCRTDCCELPFDFRVEKANSSETRVCQEMVAEILSDEEVREHCVDFVADRGLDCDPLRRQLHETGVTPLIETRLSQVSRRTARP